MTMSSFKIYLLAKLIKNKKFFILNVALFTAIFCLPIISSHAHFQVDPTNPYDQMQQYIKINNAKEPKILKLYVTAYSSTSEETDDTPCLTASGYDLCNHDLENVVACNFLPFGSQVIFPDLNPNKIYTVVDRMHKKYNSRLDIWMRDRQSARNFGLKYLTVEILP